MFWGGCTPQTPPPRSAPGRSVEFQNYVSSLDRKISKKNTMCGKMITVPVEDGETSARDAPVDCLTGPVLHYLTDQKLIVMYNVMHCYKKLFLLQF